MTVGFDLAAWRETAPITAEAALERYRDLAARSPADAVEPELKGFLEELGSAFAGAAAPWSQEPSARGGVVVMSARWSQSDRVHAVVRELARRHGLVCFDPQERQVLHPWVTLSLSDGTRVENPDAARIAAALGSLSRSRYYAILERAEQDYVQVGYAGGFGAVSYALERREGSADRHYRCELPDLARVTRAFEAFAAGEDGWAAGFAWYRVEF
ncbi:hypothetical protein Amir_3765 [Actinosynnema mirum DSM 43827]|uniref:Uncharacterized protein n=1 Tax=Actinosynnema mirum (strain ATCC 29888 / DSM 43827 / JCM 3225 / NBRC 14064 / NCIMB 13271 / NRRL B-12336 / IMRU 3971 / 101) TaxID=446462 RepID=C6WD28_ACTMD|nr:hypothetical protein Amir_3765 [Actinosynnema mirum DSM 43827]